MATKEMENWGSGSEGKLKNFGTKEGSGINLISIERICSNL
jgi:hypothetical protein